MTNYPSSDARIWIYLSHRPLDEEEVRHISQELQTFCRSWTAHGQLVRAGAMVLHHQMVLLFADESQTPVSGCSVDASVRFLRQLGERLNIDFFNRRLIATLQNDKLVVLPWEELRRQLVAGELSPDVNVVPTWLTEWKAFRSQYFIPLNQTPLYRQLLPAE
ncbi:MAG: hypothetical protein RMK52_00560 [Chitinophagales bacterium]|nr:hypothetical protein [Chitinophagales bacterium]MDW8392717.1 hypothetical protein [Chitinophagales bacterium]